MNGDEVFRGGEYLLLEFAAITAIDRFKSNQLFLVIKLNQFPIFRIRLFTR